MSDSMVGNLFALAFGLLAGAVFFLVSHLGHVSPDFPGHGPMAIHAPPVLVEGAEEAPMPTDGPGLYAHNCVACHQADGKGTPGTFPPLSGSDWASGDAETPIRILLAGVTGPIDVAGTTYDSTMPKLVLEDEQIAKILTHVRSSFGNSASAVTAAMVKKVKAEGRAEAWTAKDLTALRAPAAPEAGAAPAPAPAPAP